ncbi:hypothetical protein DFH28DRAFT_918562, partial [Melampsora americana]
SLIYSGSRNGTLEAMKVVNKAQGTPRGEEDPDSTLIRRYHSCIGKKEKLREIEGYTNDEFPIISCTNALGLGQDWPSVMQVVVLGRMGLPELAQLFGRIGVIPCDINDQRVLAEQAREKARDFPLCKCSNCNSEAANMLVHNMPRLSKSNYLQAMDDVYSVEGFLDPSKDRGREEERTKNKHAKAPKKRSQVLDIYLEELADELVLVYDLFYKDKLGDDGYYFGSDYFALDRAHRILENMDNITCEDDIKGVMGGDIIKGGVKVVFEHIMQWQTRDEGLHYRQKRIKMIEKKKEKEYHTKTNLREEPVWRPTLTPDSLIAKKVRRSSAQVKADKEAAQARAAYNKRCLHWMQVENIPANELDAKEIEYQKLVPVLCCDPSQQLFVYLIKFFSLFGFLMLFSGVSFFLHIV